MNNIKSFIKKNAFLLISILVIIIVIISASVSFAYFTKKTDVLQNEISVGKVKIELIEDKWDPEKAKAIEPATTLEKNPKIKNIGNNEAYVYITVKLPKKEVIIVNQDETLMNKEKTELFTYQLNSNWELLEIDTTASDYNLYVYGYTKEALAQNITTNPLFDTISYKNILEGQISPTEELEVDITAYAIQSETIKLEGTTLKDKMTFGYDMYLKEA